MDVDEFSRKFGMMPRFSQNNILWQEHMRAKVIEYAVATVKVCGRKNVLYGVIIRSKKKEMIGFINNTKRTVYETRKYIRSLMIKQSLNEPKMGRIELVESL